MTLAIILILCASLAMPLAGGPGSSAGQEGSAAQSSAHEQVSPQTGQESQNAPSNSGIKTAPAPCPPSEQSCEVTPAPQPAPQEGHSTAQKKPARAATPQASAKTAGGSSRAARIHKKKNKKQTVPRKIIVRDGGTSEAPKELAPDIPSDQATHSRQTTEQLLASTRANLERASARKLNPNQQNTVEQIKIFMNQSDTALKAGDLQRGHTLALKARLLSDDLLK